MRFIILELLAILRDIGVALADAMASRTACRFEHTMLVHAPRNIVWAVASARNITFDGTPPIVIKSLPSPQPGVQILEVRTGGLTCRVGLRILERRDKICEMHAVVPEHSDHLTLLTGVTATGFELADAPHGTRLRLIQEAERMNLRSRIRTPMAMRLMGRRIAAASEQAAALGNSRAAA